MSIRRGSAFDGRQKKHLGEPLSSWPGDHVATLRSLTRRALYSVGSSYQRLAGYDGTGEAGDQERGQMETLWRVTLKTRDTMVVDEFEVLLYEVSPELYEVI